MTDSEILLALPSRASSVVAAINRKRDGSVVSAESMAYEIRQAETQIGRVGVAVIEADGALSRGVSGLPWCIDYDELVEAVEEADEDDRVKVIVLCLDSPGGRTNGAEEAASRIAAISKPLMVYTPGLLCSAAYFLAASADAIVSAPSALVGNIGAYLVFYDLSKMMGNAGLTVEVVSSGELKATGYPGTALTEAQRAHLQASVNGEFNAFFSFVAGFRSELDVSLADGREVAGRDAESVGLIDGTAHTLDEAIDEWVSVLA